MTLRILPFSPEHQPYFDRLNRDWIVKYFTLEPIDEQVLSDPAQHIIAKGGEVWFASLNGEIVATYALLAREDGDFEFSKLGVATQAKGQKLGQRLLHHAYERAKARGAKKLIIYTNSALHNACQLYRDEGFVDKDCSPSEKSRYARCDTLIERSLADISAPALPESA